MPKALLQAEVLPAAEYSAAQPDPLRDAAPLLVDQMNTQRAEDVLRIAARASGVTINQMEHAQARLVQPCGLQLVSVPYSSLAVTLSLGMFLGSALEAAQRLVARLCPLDVFATLSSCSCPSPAGDLSSLPFKHLLRSVCCRRSG